MQTRFVEIKVLNSLTIKIDKAKSLREIIESLIDIYNILRYLIDLFISYKYFARI